MSNTLRGTAVVAQSGGPTTVINASACGVIQEALTQSESIETIFGATNGILGILREELFDFREESEAAVDGLKRTPASAIGSCRYKLGDPEKNSHRYRRILDVFAAHNIRYFFYIGGNDSMDTADKISQLAKSTGYDLRVMGVAKTIDNDLVGTDHCPGFGSVAKYLATSVMEAGRDTEAMWTFDPVTITEAMGRNTGWIAASTGLASRSPEDAPHLVYVPEIPFSVEQFLADVKATIERLGRCYVVVSEGITDKNGDYVAAQASVDAFGHKQLGGVAAFLQEKVTQELGLKCRHNKLDTCQRNAMHFASKTDSDEAYRCGQEAVRQAVQGTSGFMVGIDRTSQSPYQSEPKLIALSEVANGVKRLPRSFMNEAGNHISAEMRSYTAPLLVGEVPIRIGEDGLPEFIRFKRRHVGRKLATFAED